MNVLLGRLFYANLLSADAKLKQLIFIVIKCRIRNVLFKSRLALSFKRKDTTGFSSQYGWVHAFAHEIELDRGGLSSDFPKTRVHEVFDILGQLFKRITIRFTDDEDWRLARVIYEDPILQGKLEQEQSSFLDKAVNFPIEEGKIL